MGALANDFLLKAELLFAASQVPENPVFSVAVQALFAFVAEQMSLILFAGLTPAFSVDLQGMGVFTVATNNLIERLGQEMALLQGRVIQTERALLTRRQHS